MDLRNPDGAPHDVACASSSATYQVYGLPIESDFPFAYELAPGEGESRLAFCCRSSPPLCCDWEGAAHVYASAWTFDTGESRLQVYHVEDCYIMRFARVADFYLWPDRIACHPADPPDLALVEGHFLGAVLAFWLELRGVPMLHASAVVIDGAAVAFASHSGGGKSTLAAAFMQAGYPLLADDIVPVERADPRCLARPGYPTLRMWPAEADYFLGGHEALGLVHPRSTKRRVPVGPGGFGQFAARPHPLTALYLPHRRSEVEGQAGVEIEAVRPRDAMIELVRASFTPRLVEAVGMQPSRLRTFAQIVQQVPIHAITYPPGFRHLPQVRDAVVAHLRSLEP